MNTVEHSSSDDQVLTSLIKNENSAEEDWRETVTFACGKSVDTKLDTGAQCNVLPLNLAKSLGLKLTQSPVKRIVSYTQHKVDVSGECIVETARQRIHSAKQARQD